jgi:hypothetical protein
LFGYDDDDAYDIGDDDAYDMGDDDDVDDNDNYDDMGDIIDFSFILAYLIYRISCIT